MPMWDSQQLQKIKALSFNSLPTQRHKKWMFDRNFQETPGKHKLKLSECCRAKVGHLHQISYACLQEPKDIPAVGCWFSFRGGVKGEGHQTPPEIPASSQA